MREILYEKDFERYSKVAYLSNDPSVSMSHSQRIKELEEKLRKFKSELTLLESQTQSHSLLQKSKLIDNIN